MAAALDPARDSLADELELYQNIPSRAADGDWHILVDDFEDDARWHTWDIPVFENHPLLQAVLRERHPFTWFDTGPD